MKPVTYNISLVKPNDQERRDTLRTLADNGIRHLNLNNALLEHFIVTPDAIPKYEKDMTTERDIRNYISYARLEGREEGLEEGRREGEAASKREIAKALLEKGIDKAIIASCTGLSEDAIEKL